MAKKTEKTDTETKSVTQESVNDPVTASPESRPVAASPETVQEILKSPITPDAEASEKSGGGSDMPDTVMSRTASRSGVAILITRDLDQPPVIGNYVWEDRQGEFRRGQQRIVPLFVASWLIDSGYAVSLETGGDLVLKPE